MADEVLTEQRGQVLVITLNRPDAMNAIDTGLAQGLVAAMERLDQSRELAVGVLTGAGRGFSAGMDLKAFASGGTPEGFQAFIRDGCRKPLIAAVEGFALAGGLEIALACDLIVAAKGARIGIPETRVGLFAGDGGLYRLPDQLPYSITMEITLTTEPISAEQAHAYGLVSRVSEKGAALEGALDLAQRIARNAPLGVAASKQLVRASRGATEEEFWALQVPVVTDVFGSADAQEGARAFIEKREPTWSGQ
ncbi:MAG TPA: crotonase/enoyl-CoA hydratase family protein [Acidimicrobiales bacterium]|nr:crotonase/enoyl-CoA hydratase family protein [Acidimicrobiales bacterium]